MHVVATKQKRPRKLEREIGHDYTQLVVATGFCISSWEILGE
jgi:hypothetical protein